ncbi:MAG: hypothetical protein EBV05_14235 [Cyanobacteria bacterium WB6_1B_304]|nr:hypothetical protein [Cyanobacteria bacterium WB6_1B_304]
MFILLEIALKTYVWTHSRKILVGPITLAPQQIIWSFFFHKMTLGKTHFLAKLNLQSHHSSGVTKSQILFQGVLLSFFHDAKIFKNPELWYDSR